MRALPPERMVIVGEEHGVACSDLAAVRVGLQVACLLVVDRSHKVWLGRLCATGGQKRGPAWCRSRREASAMPVDQDMVLECKGNFPNQAFQFLDGRTHDASVALAEHTRPPLTGTHWNIHKNKKGDVWVLECLGKLPGNQFLDGVTHQNRVQLAPSSDKPFTGTRWRAKSAGGELFTLECLGDQPGNRFLDGNTHNGAVGLAPSSGPEFSGTLWRVARAPGSFGDDNVGVPIDE